MTSLLLSAALIVRNEERCLETCLRSLANRVDEIVVVDTGSTDRSREIAGDLGACVLRRPWIGDFAAARNASVDASRGRWILYIDADEEVVEFDRAPLEALLADPGFAAHTVLFRPGQAYTRYREYRLFRNRPDLRFRGVIHESLLPDLRQLAARHGLRIGASAIALDHHGYDGELAHKHARNLPLLQARLASEPEHVYSRDHLGTTLLGLGDETGAEAAWRHAIDVVRRLANPDAHDSLPWLHLAAFLIDRQRDAADLLLEGCAKFPDNHALTWLQARVWLEAGRYADAQALFTRISRIAPDSLNDGTLAFDASIFGAPVHAALGLCAFRLGRDAESAAHYARAEALAPHDLGIRTKRMLAEARARAAEMP